MTRATDIDEQAARWLIRLDAEGPKSGGTDRAEFEAWVSSDLRHRAAYLRLSAAWAKSGHLRALVPAGAPLDPDFLRRRARWPQWFRPLRTMGMAAIGCRGGASGLVAISAGYHNVSHGPGRLLTRAARGRLGDRAQYRLRNSRPIVADKSGKSCS